MNDPYLGVATYCGSKIVNIEHLDRQVEVSFSPKGKSVRVWLDGEELGAAPTVISRKEQE